MLILLNIGYMCMVMLQSLKDEIMCIRQMVERESMHILYNTNIT